MNDIKARWELTTASKRLVDLEEERMKLKGEVRSTRASLETYKVDLKAAMEQNQKLASQGHHHRILDGEITDPVEYAYNQFYTYAKKEYFKDIVRIAELPDKIKDYVTVFIVEGPNSENQRRPFRSMRYSIPISDGLETFETFVAQTLEHELTAYAIQGTDRNIIKKCTDSDSLITVCTSTGACYFGNEYSMDAFTKSLPKSIGKRRARDSVDVDVRHVRFEKEERFGISSTKEFPLSRKRRSQLIPITDGFTLSAPTPLLLITTSVPATLVPAPEPSVLPVPLYPIEEKRIETSNEDGYI